MKKTTKKLALAKETVRDLNLKNVTGQLEESHFICNTTGHPGEPTYQGC